MRDTEAVLLKEDGVTRVDKEIVNLIYILNEKGIKTLGCCCGHRRYKTTVIIEEINGTIRELLTGIIIPRKKRFYVKDKKGFYYLPEVDKPKK